MNNRRRELASGSKDWLTGGGAGGLELDGVPAALAAHAGAVGRGAGARLAARRLVWGWRAGEALIDTLLLAHVFNSSVRMIMNYIV